MDENTKKIKLNESDKKTISNNADICTETHGQGCQPIDNGSIDERLN